MYYEGKHLQINFNWDQYSEYSKNSLKLNDTLFYRDFIMFGVAISTGIQNC